MDQWAWNYSWAFYGFPGFLSSLSVCRTRRASKNRDSQMVLIDRKSFRIRKIFRFLDVPCPLFLDAPWGRLYWLLVYYFEYLNDCELWIGVPPILFSWFLRFSKVKNTYVYSKSLRTLSLLLQTILKVHNTYFWNHHKALKFLTTQYVT